MDARTNTSSARDGAGEARPEWRSRRAPVEVQLHGVPRGREIDRRGGRVVDLQRLVVGRAFDVLAEKQISGCRGGGRRECDHTGCSESKGGDSRGDTTGGTAHGKTPIKGGISDVRSGYVSPVTYGTPVGDRSVNGSRRVLAAAPVGFGPVTSLPPQPLSPLDGRYRAAVGAARRLPLRGRAQPRPRRGRGRVAHRPHRPLAVRLRPAVGRREGRPAGAVPRLRAGRDRLARREGGRHPARREGRRVPRARPPVGARPRRASPSSRTSRARARTSTPRPTRSPSSAPSTRSGCRSCAR